MSNERIDAIKQFGAAKSFSQMQARNELNNKIAANENKILALEPRITDLISTYNALVENGVSDEVNKSYRYDYGFTADGINHHLGFNGSYFNFNKKVDRIGINDEGTLWTDGNTIEVSEGLKNYLDGNYYLGVQQKFLNEFDNFEKTFYNTVEKCCSQFFAKTEENRIIKDKVLMSGISDVLENGEIITKSNPSLDGDVRVKRGGMNEGLVHIIDHRIRERVLNKDIQMDIEQAKKETTAILFLAIDNIDKVPAEKEKDGHFAVYNKGIKTVIGKDKNGRYVITGFDNNQEKEEATESINAVIARYGNTPEFLGIYAQVGAVISSNNILPQQQEIATKTNSPAVITVNGKTYDLPNGVKAGLVNAIIENTELLKDYNELTRDYNSLADENDKLRQQLQNRGNKPTSYS